MTIPGIAPDDVLDTFAKPPDPYEVIGQILAECATPSGPHCIQQLRDGRAYVYFIGPTNGPVKIGFSIAPYERVANLQTAHWDKLELLAKVAGTEADERTYHDRFAAARIRGEWFSRTPEIEAEIARLASLGETA